ncbi:MAG: TolC family outer membrane protein, partial [Rhizobiales bacterium]|nr:TolC family outer membrane protein [Hyphomicrobiales bacterium]
MKSIAVATCLLISASSMASADTLMQALASAYTNNPELNIARAATRAADEGVPQALSGYRPNISASGSITDHYNGIDTDNATLGISFTQDIFRGFRTVNGTKQAESVVLASRASLSNVEQNVLFSAAQAFMNVVRDQALITLRDQNVNFLREQGRATRDRFEVGETTRTDVAQSDARISLGVSQSNLARATLNSSKAVYQQIIGVAPGRLNYSYSIEKLLPNTLDAALSVALTGHPGILAATFNMDAAGHNVKVIEGELLPTVSVTGSVSRSYLFDGPIGTRDSASLTGRVTVPIYQGGRVSSRVRQAKEIRGQRQIELDLTRQQVRAAVVSSWGQLTAARALIIAADAQKQASQIALNGVIEEQRVGQRTTLDVLNAQQELLDARVNTVSARRDQVVASFALASAVGQLNAERLGLAAQ